VRYYFAATYARNAEMREHRAELAAKGHVVTSRWIDRALEREPVSWGPEQIHSRTDEARTFALTDLEDIGACHAIVFFAEDKPNSSRGGRHVEFGYALNAGKVVVLIGRYENVFSPLAHVRYDTWEDFMKTLED
jgi:hypothetical protein